MTTATLDHIVIAARTLDEGMEWVRQRLGVTVPHGGAHDHMATHNCVGRMTDDTYLEIIATNPAATPDRARWFAMDTPQFHTRLASEPAFLHHWVVNVPDIGSTLAHAQHSPGSAITMSRAALTWKITVRDDGTLARQGVIPTVIEWPAGPHPSRNMTDLGLRLEALHAETPDVLATQMDLESIGANRHITVSEGTENRLSATFSVGGETRVL